MTAQQTKLTNPKDAAASSKVPLWLLSPIAKVHWALAQFAGMLKYGAWNWRAAVVRASVYLAAMQRHMDKWASGEEYDETDMTHHLGNVMACCAILLDARQCGKLIDDRPPSVDLGELYSEAEAAADVLREQYKDRAPRHWTKADTGECFAPTEPAPAPTPTPAPAPSFGKAVIGTVPAVPHVPCPDPGWCTYCQILTARRDAIPPPAPTEPETPDAHAKAFCTDCKASPCDCNEPIWSYRFKGTWGISWGHEPGVTKAEAEADLARTNRFFPKVARFPVERMPQ